MPYITKDEREQMKLGKIPITSGQLNYVITKLAIRLKDTPMTLQIKIKDKILEFLGGRKSYTLFNEVMGVLECARREYLRRAKYNLMVLGVDTTFERLEDWLYGDLIAPYEDKKKEENGDVY